jgi:hypothetical protein
VAPAPGRRLRPGGAPPPGRRLTSLAAGSAIGSSEGENRELGKATPAGSGSCGCGSYAVRASSRANVRGLVGALVDRVCTHRP